ncbi:MAG: hypothetical protein KKF01_07110 [Proteobacteria bacterium]|nr:hypothetical protein [Pseudomonadota bacterium]
MDTSTEEPFWAVAEVWTQCQEMGLGAGGEVREQHLKARAVIKIPRYGKGIL